MTSQLTKIKKRWMKICSRMTRNTKRWRCLVILTLWILLVFIFMRVYHYPSKHPKDETQNAQYRLIYPHHLSPSRTFVKSEEKLNFISPFASAATSLNLSKPDRDKSSNVIYTGITNRPLTRFRDLFKVNYHKFPPGIGKDKVTPDTDTYLIYRCDNDRMGQCGGLGDKLKGMMTAYIIANLTGRVFKSEMKEPGCDFQDHIVPNLVNWSLSTSFHSRVFPFNDVKIMNYVGNLNFYGHVRLLNFNMMPHMKSKYVYFKSNLDHMEEFGKNLIHENQLSWMKNLTRDEINAAVFKRLFQMSPRLQSKMETFLKQSIPSPQSKLICAHVRMSEPVNHPSLPRESVASKNAAYNLPVVWNFLYGQIHNETDRIFFMSDSKEAESETKRQPFYDQVVSTHGAMMQTDRHSRFTEDDEAQCRDFQTVVFDFFVLLHCDVLMISKSGISRLAAYVRGSDVGLYCLVDRSVLPCRRNQVKDIYKVLG